RWAVKDAGIELDEMNYINAHGSSTPINDRVETLAIKKLFGEMAYGIAVSSTKSVMGHAMGGTGALEAIFCAFALQEGILPPTINYETPDPDCDLDYVPNVARRADIRVAMSNSFGLGGQNACLILQRFDNGTGPEAPAEAD
ncbi:MAG: beta-ketoacyl-[acyl-carrier-protein] synthase II, partial [Chloroflexota bacterium]